MAIQYLLAGFGVLGALGQYNAANATAKLNYTQQRTERALGNYSAHKATTEGIATLAAQYAALGAGGGFSAEQAKGRQLVDLRDYVSNSDIAANYERSGYKIARSNNRQRLVSSLVSTATSFGLGVGQSDFLSKQAGGTGNAPGAFFNSAFGLDSSFYGSGGYSGVR